MSIALLHSRTTLGIRAVPVRVEIHLGPGLPGFTVVGLADTAVRESKDRVRSALINGGFRIPQQRITVNLARPTCPRTAAASTCRSRWAFCSPADSWGASI